MLRVATLLIGLWLAFAPARADPVYQSQTIACTREVAATAGASQPVVVNLASQRIYVCGFVFAGAGTTPTATLFWAATGTACATPLGTVVPVITLPVGGAIVDHQTYYAGLPPVPTGSDLCATVVGVGTQILVYYAQF